MTAYKHGKVLVGRWYDNEADADAWCKRQKKPACVIEITMPNGTKSWMAVLESIAKAAGVTLAINYSIKKNEP